MSWLDVGNGWRNLFLLSCLLQMGALGCLFAARGWFSPQSRLACFLTGVAATPLAQYLWMLLWALVWPKAPRVMLIGAPPALAAVGMLVLALRRVSGLRQRLEALCAWLRRALRFDKPALAALCFALCMALLVGPACVRFMSSMNIVSGGDAGEYMGLAQRYCEDRNLAELLEKEETVGHFRGHSHFPSLELYMSYGLLHTSGQVGYPNDKAAFTGVGMLIFYAVAAYLALLLIACREKKVCVLLGLLLLNLVPELFVSVAGAPRDIWRILALLWAALAFGGLREDASRAGYLGKLLWVFALCFTVMSAHVVCFVVLPFIVAAWVLWRFLHAGLTGRGEAWRALLRAVGLAVSGALGTLAGFAGNLWCFWRWGELSPWRLMTTFTDAPWYDMYMDMEYKLEETTTHLSFWQAKDSILMSYSTSVGMWALRLAAVALAGALVYLCVAQTRMRRQATIQLAGCTDGPTAVLVRNGSPWALLASDIGYLALLTLLTLAPMTGVLDSPLYCFSGSFVKLPRYTLQWFFIGNVMICACLSALLTAWPNLLKRCRRSVPAWAGRLPAWLCVLLCVLAMAKGTNQMGYTNTFYRSSRGVMESQTLLLDNGFRQQYELMRRVADAMDEDQKMLITRVGYQYALRGRGYVLTTNPIVPLMNLPLEEVEGALREMRVAALATEPTFWDERYYTLSTLHAYLSALPEEQVVETEKMRLYLLDPRLAETARQVLEGGAV